MRAGGLTNERKVSLMGSDVTPATLTKAQARRLTDKIAESADHLWTLLLEAHDRKAWLALGYDSFTAYTTAEFGMTSRNAYRLVNQGSVVREIVAAANVTRASVIGVSARAAEELKPDLPALTEKVAAAVKDVPKKERPAVVKELLEEHRKRKSSSASPPSSEEPKQEPPAPPPPALPDPQTVQDIVRLGALIESVGAAKLAKCWPLDLILRVNRVVVETHRLAAPPVTAKEPSAASRQVQVTPMFKSGKA